MQDKDAIAATILFVVACWILVVWIWKSSNKRLDRWREIIKKDDHCYLINQLGEKAYVKVLAVDRSRSRPIHIEIEWDGKVTDQWVEAKFLFPAPKGEY